MFSGPLDRLGPKIPECAYQALVNGRDKVMDTKINAAANRINQAGAKSAPKTAPKPELPPNLPAELFTPEALEACPHARAMFERMKSMEQSPQPQGPSLQSVKLAEEGSWVQEKAPANFQPQTEAAGQWSRRDDIEYAL